MARALKVAEEATSSKARIATFNAAADEISTSRSLLDVSGFRATNAVKELLQKQCVLLCHGR